MARSRAKSNLDIPNDSQINELKVDLDKNNDKINQKIQKRIARRKESVKNKIKKSKDEIINNKIADIEKISFTPTITKTNIANKDSLDKDTNIYFVSFQDNFIVNKISDNIKKSLDLDKLFKTNVKTFVLNYDFNNLQEIISEIQSDTNNKYVVTFSQLIFEKFSNIFKDTYLIPTLLLSSNKLSDNSKLSISKKTFGVRAPLAFTSISNVIKKSFADKQIIILYSSLEQESAYGYKKLIESFKKYHINNYIKYNVKNKSDIENLQVLENDAEKSVVLLITSNIFLNNNQKVKEIFEKIKMPIIAFSKTELEKFNGVLSLGVNYTVLGSQTGEIINNLLKNNNFKPKESIALAKLYELTVNLKHANEIEFNIPQDLIKNANSVIK
ncbi:MAG: hypothetical protein SPJ04_07330 [Bdellovibrionota bacterium]|nr:hypothetical protein [Pseudomonadota bacterium]MDY6091046.1 hypothetical protein [Bdellovibrionota bacterium]